MSLKTKQILRNCQFTERQPRIYSTGVYLVPMKISIHGSDQFVWVTDDFDNDSFDNGGDLVSPYLISNNLDEIFEINKIINI